MVDPTKINVDIIYWANNVDVTRNNHGRCGLYQAFFGIVQGLYKRFLLELNKWS